MDPIEEGNTDMKGYYVNRIGEYSNMISFLAQCLEAEISLRLSPGEAKNITKGALRAFISLLPDLPYLGGHDNPLTEHLLGAAYEMGVYKLLEFRGLNLCYPNRDVGPA